MISDVIIDLATKLATQGYKPTACRVGCKVWDGLMRELRGKAEMTVAPVVSPDSWFKSPETDLVMHIVGPSGTLIRVACESSIPPGGIELWDETAEKVERDLC